MPPQSFYKSWAGILNRRLQFFRDMDVSAKLNFGFGSLLILMVTIIVLCFYTVYMAHSDITRSVEEFYPVTHEVEDLQQKLWSMILKERAYLVLGGRTDRAEFRRAEKRFSKQIENLRKFVSVEDYSVLKEISEDFKEWQAYSGNVFELRQKPVENYPALKIYKSDIQSLRVSVFRYIRAIESKIESDGASDLPIRLLGALLEYKNSLEKVFSNLEEYAKTGNPSFRYLLDSYIHSSRTNLGRLVNLGRSSDADIENLVESISEDHDKIGNIIPEILEIAGSEERSKALQIFKEKITPLADKMIDTLEGFNRTKQNQLNELLGNTGDQLEFLEKIVIITAILAAFISFLSIWAVYNTLTRPVRALSDTAERIAQGNFYTRCSLETKDELGRLAKSFNTMTSRLQGTISKLENHRLYLKEMVEEQTVEVRNSREDLRITLDSIGDAVVATDSEGRVKRMNPVARNLSGCSFEEAEGKPFYEIFTLLDPETDEVETDPVKTVLETGEIISNSSASALTARDGGRHRVQTSGSPIPDKEGKIAGVVVVLRDVSASCRLEEELEANRYRLRRLIDNLPGGMAYRCDNNRNYTMSWISRGALSLTGYSPEDLMEDRTVAYGDLIHPDDRDHVWETVQAGLKRRESFHVQYRIRSAGGEEKWVWEKGSGVYSKDNGLMAVEGIISDITEQKEAEKEMIAVREQAAEQDKNALIGQVAGKMAHDFNNILAGIMGNAELSLMDCRKKDASAPEVAKSLELICDLTERGKSLTRNLIAFARDQEIKLEYIHLNEHIEFVLNLLRNELGPVEVVKKPDENLPRVLADASMIEHMLVNLVQNSIHAMGKVKKPVLRVTTAFVDGNITLEIEDNGCGIPKEHADDIYTPSFTLKGSRDSAGVYQKGIKGTGYGMSNVKKYVEKHKGSISFESTPGSGTKFTVKFPVTKEDLSAEEIRQSVSRLTQAGRRILLVEDEEIISRMQKLILEKEPLYHSVDLAFDGEEAVRLFDENEYDLVSLDFVLPGDAGGMDVYGHIREKNTEIPILFISGNLEFIESINRIRERDDRVDHLSKPCKNTDYVASINRLLSKV